MKWTIYELIKLQNTNNQFSATIDYFEEVKSTDILDITPVLVEGDFEIFDNDLFIFNIDITCTLTLACAITLKEVKYDISITVEEIFSSKQNEEHNTIEGITIDLSPIVWQNILLEKPMRVLSENAYDDFEEENIKLKEEKETNKAFANLKNYIK